MSAGRGRWRGLNSGRERGSSLQFRGRTKGLHPNQPRRQTVAQPPSPPLGPILATLSEDDLASSPDLYRHPAGIICREDITSYNWLNAKEPTIMVPGLHTLSPRLAILEITASTYKNRETDSHKRKAPSLDTPEHDHEAQGRRRELLS